MSTVTWVDRNVKVLLSITDARKTIIYHEGLSRGGHRDVREPASHAGASNFIQFIDFAVRQADWTLENNWKTCNSRDT